MDGSGRELPLITVASCWTTWDCSGTLYRHSVICVKYFPPAARVFKGPSCGTFVSSAPSALSSPTRTLSAVFNVPDSASCHGHTQNARY